MALRDVLRVLVIDDMSTSRGLILQALEALGVTNVSHAENGRIGLMQARQSAPHLVFSDLYMPELNGLQVLQQLRTGPTTAKIGFILVSGRGDEAVLRTGMQLGMNNFLTKPFTVHQFKDCLEAVVGRI